MKSKKGITLISLIITIIILMILAYRLKDFIAPEGIMDKAVDTRTDTTQQIKESRNYLKDLQEENIDVPND